MIKKILKWVGILLAGLVALFIIGLFSLYFITMDKLNKVYEIPPSGISVSSDPESIARGKHLVTVMGMCTGCHQEDFSGTVDDEGYYGCQARHTQPDQRQRRCWQLFTPTKTGRAPSATE